MPTSRIPRHVLDRFGLSATTESTRIKLPLKGVECDFAVFCGVAEVTIKQIFFQENQKPLDCEYLFPLPADASVYSCEADINGRVIRAQVRERGEARQLAEEKKAAGFRTALVEAERDNLFTLSLGNVQPQDLVVIELRYFQPLRSLAGMPSMEIPFCPGIRYIPGKPLIRTNKGRGTIDDTDEVPDASRLSPMRIEFDHQDAAYVEVRGTLEARFVLETDLGSPSHPIVVQRAGEEIRITLADKGDVPDRDFVLRWKEMKTESVVSRAWIQQKDEAAYALLEIRAPQPVTRDRGPVDFYFLVDRSGSMANEKWHKAVEALKSCVKVLGPSDRAMVTLFESQYQDFAEQPLNAKQLLGDQQFEHLQKLGARGGTELKPALEHVLEVAARHSKKCPKNLILITDAQIGNEPAILELMRRAPDMPVHCFGMDIALNDALLLALCRQQGGTFHSLNPNDDVQQAVSALGRTLVQPVLLDLHLSDGWETAEAKIPSLYAGQVHYLSARSSCSSPLFLQAQTGSSEPVKIKFATQPADFEAPYLHWCKSRIQRFMAEGNPSAAVELSIKSNLVCSLTAFVAWDDSEKVPLANHHLVQPCLQETALCGFVTLQSKFTRSSDLRRSAAAGLFDSSFGEAEPTQHQALVLPSPTREKLLLMREESLQRKLSNICDRVGIKRWKTLVKEVFKWLNQAQGDERLRRTQALAHLVAQLEHHAAPLLAAGASPSETQRVEATKKIEEILIAFLEPLPKSKALSWLSWKRTASK